MSDKLYKVGMYIRLSKENIAYANGGSASIENQQAILSKFVSIMPGWVETRTYIDNGATGGHFNRQGFQDMMTDVRNGVINLVLVHDLSRFGRNYLETGKYLEEELPALGCRFVALADSIDTETGENDIMPFLNAMNDHYLKNISDKIKTVFHAKARDGQKLTGPAPYGYMRNPADKTRLIVDETAAGVIKRIFEMRAEGLGYGKIAQALNNDEIPPPRLYSYLRQNREPTQHCSKQWQIHVLPNILRNEVYCGHTVSFRHSRSYRTGRARMRREDDWLRVPDTHEAIIHQSLWDRAQEVNDRLAKTVENASAPQNYLFSGKLYCADCKVVMMPHSQKRDSGERRNTYSCKTYHVTGRTECSRHAIGETPLAQIILDDIHRHADQIQLDEDDMLHQLQKRLIAGYEADKVDVHAERMRLKQELHKISLRIEQLYSDKVTGVITADSFTQLAGKLETRRQEADSRLAALEQTQEQAKAKLGDIRKWMELIKQHAAAIELDRDMLDTLVERVEVVEKRIVDDEKVQDVRIYWRFVELL